MNSTRLTAILEALLATLIWSSSFVLIQLGMKHIGPLALAGLRYLGAGLLLAPLLMTNRNAWQNLSARMWLRLAAIGVAAYTVGNAAFYVALRHASPTAVTLISGLGPIVVWFISLNAMIERPNRTQTIGLMLSLLGSVFFFIEGTQAQVIGVVIATLGLLSYTLSSIWSRELARDRYVSTLALTALPLFLGGALLSVVAVQFEGLPTLSVELFGLLFLLIVVHTVFGYLLYNHALQTLTALEMSITLNLSPLGAALIAWFVSREAITGLQFVGMIIVIAGIVMVQRRGQNTTERQEVNYA